MTITAPALSSGYEYDDRGALTLQKFNSGGGGTTTYSRDPAGRMTWLSRDVTSSSYDVSWSFSRNPAQQLVQEGRSNASYSYTGRYDVNRNYATNGLNQYTQAGPAAFCHDANGNLTADGGFVYLYDVENRLVAMRDQVNADCGALQYTGTLRAEMRYDPMGRLYQSWSDTQGTQRFLIDGDAMLAEYDGVGALLRRYVHGASGGRLRLGRCSIMVLDSLKFEGQMVRQ